VADIWKTWFCFLTVFASFKQFSGFSQLLFLFQKNVTALKF